MVKPKVFIIVLNWNRADDTLDCLRSLEKMIVKDFVLGVIIVDNGSDDNSVDRIRKFGTDNFAVEIIENGKNLGFAKGNNVGINYALKKGASYQLLLNNDTIADRHLITELLNCAKKHKDAGIFTPKIYFAGGFEFHKKYKRDELGRVIWSAGGNIDWDNVYATNNGVDEVDTGQFDHDKETEFATGAALFIRSEVIRKYGTFDERYFMYYEDVDLCERYKRSGGCVMYTHKAVLWHKVAQSSGIGSNLNDYFTTRNRLLFGMGYARLRTKLALYKESVRLLMDGRPWQKKGVIDFYTAKFGKGSWNFKLNGE